MELSKTSGRFIHSQVYPSSTSQVPTQVDQLTKSDYTSQKFPPERIMRLQQITGTLLFYAKAIYFTILVALGTILSAQTSGTIEIEKAAHKLVDYCDTHHNTTLRYKASGMVLKSHSDASYFS